MTEHKELTQLESERCVVGTMMAGVLGEREAIEIGGMISAAGGVELFDDVICNELWRRADAALRAGKPPWAYRLIKQVEPVSPQAVAEALDCHISGFLIESVYLPDLVASSQERRARRICASVAAGGDISEAVKALHNGVAPVKETKTTAQICQEIIQEWETAAENPGKISGITTGLIDVDRLTGGWQKSNLVVIGARPSRGKTGMLLGFARAAAIDHNVPTLFLTLESPVKELIKRMCCQIANSDQKRLRDGNATERDIRGLPSAFLRIRKAPLYWSDMIGSNIDSVQRVISEFVQYHGVKLVMVDYLQKIKPMHANEKRTYEIAQASEGLKIAANRNNVPIITACQINREPEKNKGRKAFLTDLSDSGQIERDADLVGLIQWRQDDGGNLCYSLDFQKFRDGPTGEVDLHFTPQCARFDNAARIDPADYRQTHPDA